MNHLSQLWFLDFWKVSGGNHRYYFRSPLLPFFRHSVQRNLQTAKRTFSIFNFNSSCLFFHVTISHQNFTIKFEQFCVLFWDFQNKKKLDFRFKLSLFSSHPFQHIHFLCCISTHKPKPDTTPPHNYQTQSKSAKYESVAIISHHQRWHLSQQRVAYTLMPAVQVHWPLTRHTSDLSVSRWFLGTANNTQKPGLVCVFSARLLNRTCGDEAVIVWGLDKRLGGKPTPAFAGAVPPGWTQTATPDLYPLCGFKQRNIKSHVQSSGNRGLISG